MFGRTIFGCTMPNPTMANRTVPCRLALGSPYSKPSTTTAEDGLPHPERRCRRKLLSQYSRGLEATQCARPASKAGVGSAAVYGRSHRVVVQKSSARCSCDGSNAHSERAEALKTGVRTFQRNPEAANDRLRDRRIRGSGSRQKSFRKIWREQTQVYRPITNTTQVQTQSCGQTLQSKKAEIQRQTG